MPTRNAQAERTRQAVLDTARGLFSERGFAATSLQQIADAMGVTKANVYYYFRTKDSILDALLDERVSTLEELLEEVSKIDELIQRRRTFIVGYVEQVVIAHRTMAPLNFADPSVRAQSRIAQRLDELEARAAQLAFGDAPTLDQLAGFAMLLDLKPALRRTTHLPDAELRRTLERLCLRTIGDPAE